MTKYILLAFEAMYPCGPSIDGEPVGNHIKSRVALCASCSRCPTSKNKRVNCTFKLDMVYYDSEQDRINSVEYFNAYKPHIYTNQGGADKALDQMLGSVETCKKFSIINSYKNVHASFKYQQFLNFKDFYDGEHKEVPTPNLEEMHHTFVTQVGSFDQHNLSMKVIEIPTESVIQQCKEISVFELMFDIDIHESTIINSALLSV